MDKQHHIMTGDGAGPMFIVREAGVDRGDGHLRSRSLEMLQFPAMVADAGAESESVLGQKKVGRERVLASDKSAVGNVSDYCK